MPPLTPTATWQVALHRSAMIMVHGAVGAHRPSCRARSSADELQKIPNALARESAPCASYPSTSDSRAGFCAISAHSLKPSSADTELNAFGTSVHAQLEPNTKYEAHVLPHMSAMRAVVVL